MPFPTLTFAHMLDNRTRQELEQFVSLLQGYLSEQHKEDGSHEDITADSVDVTGDGSFDGNVTADADSGPVITGAFTAFDATVNRAGNGIDMRCSGTGASASRWRIVASDGGSNFRDLLFQDLVGGLNSYTFRVYWDASASEYAIEPIDVSPMRLGTNTTGERFTEVNTLIARAFDGYLERGRSVKVGEWTSVAFNAGNFTGNGSMTWTVASGDQTTFAYTLIGKTMTVAFNLVTTTVGGTPDTTLQITIPGSFTAAKTIFNGAALYVDNGTRTTGSVGVASGGTVISLVKTDGTAWTASTDATSVLGEITFEIQ